MRLQHHQTSSRSVARASTAKSDRLTSMDSFKGQIAVVTGASSGIGKAIALSLAERGATVCLVARGVKALQEIASSNRGVSDELVPYQADLAKHEDINLLVGALDRKSVV